MLIYAGCWIEGADDAAAQAAGKISGVRKVLQADGAQYAHRLAESLWLDLIVSLAGDYEAIVKSANDHG